MTHDKDSCIRRLVCADDRSHGVSDWMSGPVTAACFARPYLHFATLQAKGEANFKLIAKGCAAFWFDDRTPQATRELQVKVHRFVSKMATHNVVLRCTDMNGTYAAVGLAFKAEAMLDLAIGSSLLLARTTSVARWVYGRDYALPEPVETDLPSQWYKGQVKAIETAAYVLSGGKVVEAGGLAL